MLRVVPLLVLLSTGCATIRASAGPTLDTDGRVGFMGRVSFGIGAATDSDRGFTVVGDGFGGTAGGGAAGGVDFVHVDARAARLGGRVGATVAPDRTEVTVGAAAAVAAVVRARPGSSAGGKGWPMFRTPGNYIAVGGELDVDFIVATQPRGPLDERLDPPIARFFAGPVFEFAFSDLDGRARHRLRERRRRRSAAARPPPHDVRPLRYDAGATPRPAPMVPRPGVYWFSVPTSLFRYFGVAMCRDGRALLLTSLSGSGEPDTTEPIEGTHEPASTPGDRRLTFPGVGPEAVHFTSFELVHDVTSDSWRWVAVGDLGGSGAGPGVAVMPAIPEAARPLLQCDAP